MDKKDFSYQLRHVNKENNKHLSFKERIQKAHKDSQRQAKELPLGKPMFGRPAPKTVYSQQLTHPIPLSQSSQMNVFNFKKKKAKTKRKVFYKPKLPALPPYYEKLRVSELFVAEYLPDIMKHLLKTEV